MMSSHKRGDLTCIELHSTKGLLVCIQCILKYQCQSVGSDDGVCRILDYQGMQRSVITTITDPDASSTKSVLATYFLPNTVCYCVVHQF